MKMHPMNVKALWFDPDVGSKGFYGAILSDGTPIALCSKEKWDMGPQDSLSKNWQGHVKIFNIPHTIYVSKPEQTYRAAGLLKNTKLEMNAPKSLMNLGDLG